MHVCSHCFSLIYLEIEKALEDAASNKTENIENNEIKMDRHPTDICMSQSCKIDFL